MIYKVIRDGEVLEGINNELLTVVHNACLSGESFTVKKERDDEIEYSLVYASLHVDHIEIETIQHSVVIEKIVT